MCVASKAAGKNCTQEWRNVGSVQVACSAGKLVLSSQEERGFVMGDLLDVVATCGNSAFTAKSSCNVANAAGTTVTRASGVTELASPEWDNACVCKDTGRRPVVKIVVNDVIAGAACQS